MSASWVSFIEPPPAETSVIDAGEEAGAPYLVAEDGWLPLPFLLSGSLTNQERNATQVKTRHALPFAPCVSLLFVLYSCRLIVCFLRSKPPTVQSPYFACQKQTMS